MIPSPQVDPSVSKYVPVFFQVALRDVNPSSTVDQQANGYCRVAHGAAHLSCSVVTRDVTAAHRQPNEASVIFLFSLSEWFLLSSYEEKEACFRKKATLEAPPFWSPLGLFFVEAAQFKYTRPWGCKADALEPACQPSCETLSDSNWSI